MAQNGSNDAGHGRRRWLVIGIIALAVLLLAAFISMSRKSPVVRVAHASAGPIESTITTNGKIAPMDNWEAHAPAAGTVLRVLVQQGDPVKAGQLLVQLDNGEARSQEAKARAQLSAAEADLNAIRSGGTHEEVLTAESQLLKAQSQVESAQRNFNALRRLEQAGAASAGEVQAAEAVLRAAQTDLKLLEQKRTKRYSNQDLERAKAQVEEARAALSAAQDLLRRLQVQAPRAGAAYSLPVRAGQFVNAGDLLAQVADLRTMQVRGYVDEPDLGRLRSGESVQITWDAVPGRTWEGSLTRLPSTVVALGSRNVGEIVCSVNNSDLKLLPNINVNVNIVTARAENAIILPREAVHQEDGNRYVYQVVDGKLRHRNVQTGISTLTYIQITDGLASNAQVALGAVNNQALREGMSVRTVLP